jgi:hypothetical protein
METKSMVGYDRLLPCRRHLCRPPLPLPVHYDVAETKGWKKRIWPWFQSWKAIFLAKDIKIKSRIFSTEISVKFLRKLQESFLAGSENCAID